MGIGIFTLALGANEAREAAITGEYFELRNALYPVALIELLDRTGSVIARLDNPEQSDFVRPGRYDTVRITNGATAQTVKHFYGTGDAGSRRTSGLVNVEGTVDVVGDVRVVGVEQITAVAGGLFAASIGIGPTNFGAAQLWNPLGSGKNLIVRNTKTVITGGASVVCAPGMVALTNDVTAARMACMRIGGALGVAQARTQDFASFYTYALGSLFVNPMMVTNPVIIPPGCGLNFYGTVVGQSINADVIFTEEAI